MIRMKSIVNYSALGGSIVHSKGAALLVVLFIVMAITILSLGFLSRSDVELACGRNMILRTQIDYVAESGLEHARGLILNPQDVASEYWTGAEAQQLVAGSAEYYDLDIVRDDSDPTDYCNYTIDCNAYWMEGGEKIGRSEVTALLRLDPCIALWAGEGSSIWSGITINGDVYCAGSMSNSGSVNGDMFAVGSISGLVPEGRLNPSVGQPLVTWPLVQMSDLIWGPYYIGTNSYSAELVSTYSHPSGSFGPSGSNPAGIRYRASLQLPGNVDIQGTIVTGNLMSLNSNNIVRATKNFPALFVDQDLILGPGAELEIEGLAVVGGNVLVSADNAALSVLGGLFVRQQLAEVCYDSSGNYRMCILHNGPIWRPFGGQIDGALEFDGLDDVIEDTTAGDYLNGLSGITVTLWIKSDVTDEDRGILFTRDPTGADQCLGLRYERNGASGGGVRGVKASIQTTSGFTQIESSSSVQTTNWQHIALTWEDDPNDSRLKLYINGGRDTLRYDMGPTFGTIMGVQKLMIGCGTKNRYWDGRIDDVRIYNRCLDVSEINHVGTGATAPGLICRWGLDERGSQIVVTAVPMKTAIEIWPEPGNAHKWEQAAGAFFKKIERK
jgi:hypothetical protein